MIDCPYHPKLMTAGEFNRYATFFPLIFMFNRNIVLFSVLFVVVTKVTPAFAGTKLPYASRFTSMANCPAAPTISELESLPPRGFGILNSSYPPNVLGLGNTSTYEAVEINNGYYDSTHVRILITGVFNRTLKTERFWVKIKDCGRLPVFYSTSDCVVGDYIMDQFYPRVNSWALPIGQIYRLSKGAYYPIFASSGSNHVRLQVGGDGPWTAIDGCGKVINVGETTIPSGPLTPAPTQTTPPIIRNPLPLPFRR